MKIILVIYSLLIFVSATALPAETDSLLQAQLRYSNKLFSEEKYFDAVTEYKRLIYFDGLKQLHFTAYCKMAECFRSGARLDDAISAYTSAIQCSPNTSAKDKIKLEIAKLQMLKQDFGASLSILQDLEKSLEQKSTVSYWRGWIYMFMDRWEDASKEFSISDSTIKLKDFCDSISQKRYDPEKARLLSAILPGTGQLYTGNYFQAAVSFAWNALWLYDVIDAFAADRIFDGVVVGEMLWFRFYFGGRESAENMANEKNKRIFQESLLFLNNEFKGFKP